MTNGTPGATPGFFLVFWGQDIIKDRILADRFYLAAGKPAGRSGGKIRFPPDIFYQ